MSSKLLKIVLVTASLALGVVTLPGQAEARQVNNTTRTSVHAGSAARSANVNSNVNVNRNVNANVNRNVNVHRDIDVDVDRGYYRPVAPVARAAGVAATAAVVGSMVYSLPPSCTSMVSAGVTYQRCGSTYYQPRYSGSQVSYVVVNPP